MTHEEAQKLLFTVPWKSEPCWQEKCWCAVVTPADPILDEEGGEYWIIPAGSVSKEMAEHIVSLHNRSLEPSS